MIETVFQYERVMRMANGTWANTEIRFFGNVVSGALSLDDTVLVPVIGGDPVSATVARFTDDFTQESWGLPFYDTIRPDSIGVAFCACIDGSRLDGALIAPSGALVAQPVA